MRSWISSGLTAMVNNSASSVSTVGSPSGRFGYSIPLVWSPGHGHNIFVSAAFTPAEYHNSLQVCWPDLGIGDGGEIGAALPGVESGPDLTSLPGSPTCNFVHLFLPPKGASYSVSGVKSARRNTVFMLPICSSRKRMRPQRRFHYGLCLADCVEAASFSEGDT